MSLRDAIMNVLKEQTSNELDEAAENGGGVTGISKVADPTGTRAQAPGASKTQGDLSAQKLSDGVTGVEETDPENNTNTTDTSAQNQKTIVAKGASMKEHVDSIFAGEELSEEFKEKASAIFEAAVAERVIAIEEEYTQLIEEKVKELEEQAEAELTELTAKLDEYLTYAVEQWMQENKVALEHSLRTEITEEFIEKMKNLFTESYIEIPEEKYNVVEELTAKLEELEGKLNESVEQNIKLTNSIIEMAREEIIEEASNGLAVTQAEKLKEISESVEFDSIESFQKKISIIKENYFPTVVEKKSSRLLEESFDGEEQTPVNGSMAKYVKAISKTVTK